jgi:hypothetical protein
MKKADQVDVAALEAEIAAKAQEAPRPTAETEKVSSEDIAAEAPTAPSSAPETPETESTTTPAAEPVEAESAGAPEKEA